MSSTPFFSRRPVIMMVIILGAIVVLGHIVGAIWLGMTLSNWMSGAAIGLLLLIFGLAHVFIPGHVRNHIVNMNRQWLYFFISIVGGVIMGLFADVLAPFIGWWYMIPFAVANVALGRYLDGNPQTKSLRLLTYGFVAALTFLSLKSPSDLGSNLQIALFVGACTLLLGFLVHLVVGPRPRNKGPAA